MNNTQRLKKPCNRCNKLFQPTGPNHKICDDCRTNVGSKYDLKERYFATKEELDILRSEITLKKWELLSKAYKLGRRIWGTHFTKQQLAFDMELPMTTVLRCLSLDKANKRSLKLMRVGKISSFKLAMICHQKSLTYQDEIVNMVIEDKMSTYQIKSLKIKNLSDINKERHRVAIQLGYSRKSSAYINFKHWIERGKLFLLLNEEYLPDKKIDELKDDLKELNKNIEKYLSK